MLLIITKAFGYNDQQSIQWLSQYIAKWVKGDIEPTRDQGKQLTSNDMLEFDKCVEDGVYKALFTLANADVSQVCRRLLAKVGDAIPNYWETPELDDILSRELNVLKNKTVAFKSQFLNEQLNLGNIYQVNDTQHIRIKGSFEFENVDYNHGKKHLAKITSELKKEGYVYDFCIDAYAIKQIFI